MEIMPFMVFYLHIFDPLTENFSAI